MRKSFIFLLLSVLLISSLKSIAQNGNSTDSANNKTKEKYKGFEKFSDYFFPKNSIFFEGFGCGIFYSLNYERILFQKSRHALGLRVGASYIPIANEKMFAYPMLFNYNFHILNGFYFEAGLGGIYIHENYFFSRGSRKSDYLNIGANMGFRFLIKKHFLIKAEATASIPTSSKYYISIPAVSGGLSLGYSFGLPKHLRKKRDFSNMKPKEKIQKNSIFIEGLGSGYFYSLNYERVFYSKKFYALNVRIGYSFFPYCYAYINNIPLLINFQKKITDKTIFETGLGARYTFSFINKHELNMNAIINPHYNPINTVDIIGSIGVRFLIKKYFFIKTACTPTIIYDKNYAYHGVGEICQFFSLSMGYTWDKSKQ